MDRPVRAELREAPERVGDVSLGQERLQLVAEARGREIADEPHLDRRAREPLRVRVHAEAEPVLVPQRAEDARGVVDEGKVVEYADRVPVEVAVAAERVNEPAEVGAL